MLNYDCRLIFVLVGVLLFAGCSKQIANQDSAGKNIICFGDSITSGLGVAAEDAYPAILSQKLGRSVINAGVSGDTTQHALKRLKADVLNKDPFLVIVEFGANDFFHKIPVEETFANMEEIVKQIQHAGAMVVLAEVRLELMRNEYHKGFAGIARRYEALLIPNIMQGVISNPDLKIDTLHPNERGYDIIAGKIYKYILPLLD